jgi:hypothetical protein
MSSILCSVVVIIPFYLLQTEQQPIRDKFDVLRSSTSLLYVVLLDNTPNPSDQSRQDAHKFVVSLSDPRVQLVENAFTRDGVIGAKSYAIEYFLTNFPAARFLAFLDVKSIPASDWLDNLALKLSAQSTFDERCIGPQLSTSLQVQLPGFNAAGRIGSAAGITFDGPLEDEKSMVFVLGHYQRRGATLHYGHKKHRQLIPDLVNGFKECKVFCPCLCACMYTRECLQAVQTMQKDDNIIDYRLGHYYGCPDLGFKAHLLGFRFAVDPAALCYRLDALKDEENKPLKRLTFEYRNRHVQTYRFYPNPEEHFRFWIDNQEAKKMRGEKVQSVPEEEKGALLTDALKIAKMWSPAEKIGNELEVQLKTRADSML